MKSKIQKLKDEVKQGLDTNDAVIRLHKLDFKIIESIKFVLEEYGIPLGKAKHIVTSNEVWADVVKTSDKMHEELISQLGEIDGVEVSVKEYKP
jgi:hypothetical protein